MSGKLNLRHGCDKNNIFVGKGGKSAATLENVTPLSANDTRFEAVLIPIAP